MSFTSSYVFRVVLLDESHGLIAVQIRRVGLVGGAMNGLVQSEVETAESFVCGLAHNRMDLRVIILGARVISCCCRYSTQTLIKPVGLEDVVVFTESKRQNKNLK